MIGTRNEGSLHAGLKEYYRRPGARVEAEVDGYIIDLVQGDCLLEIQTGNFSALKPKLRSLLPNYRLHVVFPIPLERYLVYVDQTTGEVLTRRRSPKKGTIYDLFGELIRIPQFLPHPNLTVEAVYIVEEEIGAMTAGAAGVAGSEHRDRRLCAVTGKQVFGPAGDCQYCHPICLSPLQINSWRYT